MRLTLTRKSARQRCGSLRWALSSVARGDGHVNERADWSSAVYASYMKNKSKKEESTRMKIWVNFEILTRRKLDLSLMIPKLFLSRAI